MKELVYKYLDNFTENTFVLTLCLIFVLLFGGIIIGVGKSSDQVHELQMKRLEQCQQLTDSNLKYNCIKEIKN